MLIVWVFYRFRYSACYQSRKWVPRRGFELDLYRESSPVPTDRWLFTESEMTKAFVVIIFIGVASSFLVLPPNRVIRSDGTVVKLETTTKIRDEFSGMVRLLKDWKTIGRLLNSISTSPCCTKLL